MAGSVDAATLKVALDAQGVPQQLELIAAGFEKVTGSVREMTQAEKDASTADAAATRAAIQANRARQEQEKATRDASRATIDWSSATKSATTSLVSYAAAYASAGAVVAGLTKYLFDSVDAWKVAEQTQLKLANMLDIVGDRAGRTTEDILKFSSALSQVTNFDDESIADAATALLKFGSVTGDSLDRALRLSADLATMMGTDVRQAAETVGKALENSYGTSMLRRAGLLTDAQIAYLKALRESGDTMTYQVKLFEMLESRVGGLAEAMGAQGLAGAQTQLANAWEDLQEEVGKVAVEFLGVEDRIRATTAMIRELLDIKAPQDAFKWLYDLQAALTPTGSAPNLIAQLGSMLFQRKPQAELTIPTDEIWGITPPNMSVEDLLAWNEERTRQENRRGGGSIDPLAVAVSQAEKWGDDNEMAAATAALAKQTKEKEKAAKASNDLGKAERELAKAMREQQKVIDDLLKSFSSLTDEFGGVTKEQLAYNAALEKLAKIEVLDTFGMLAPALAKMREEIEKTNPAFVEVAKQAEAYRKEIDKLYADMEKGTKSIEEKTAALEKETATMGMNAESLRIVAIQEQEAALATAQHALELEYASQDGPNVAYVAQLEKRIAALKKYTDALNEANSRMSLDEKGAASEKSWAKWTDGISNSLTDALLRGFEGGKDFAKNFRDTIVNMFKTMILRPVIEFGVKGGLSMLGGGLSSLFPGLASAGLGDGGGGLGGGLGGIGDLLSLFTGGGGGGFLTESILGGGSLASLFGGLTTFGSSAFTAGGLGVGFGASASTMLTAGASILPAVLPLIAAGLAIASMFGAFERGGPKSGGYAATPGLDLGPAFAGDNNRYFTPNSADAELMKIVEATQKSYADIIKSLGGTAGDFKFAIGYDTDPEGTANDRAHIGAWVNGKQVYNYESGDDSLGRDGDALEAAIEIETKRALLAAIQASDLPEAISNILNEVNASTATEEQITNITALASAYKQIDELFSKNPQEEALKLFESSTESFSRMGDDLRKMLDTFDGTAASTQTLTDATVSYWNSLVQLLANIESVRRSIEASIEQTRRGIALAVAPDDEARYAMYQDWFKNAQERLANAKDPESINRYVSEAQSALINAFNLLSEEDQRKLAPDFLENLNSLEEIANRQLEVARLAAEAQAQALAEAIKAAIDAAAVKIGDAGADVKTGGQSVLDAAKLFVAGAGKVDLAADKIAHQQITITVVGGSLVGGGA